MNTFQKTCIMRGGKREGSGRKVGSNIYGEPTKPLRIPLSLVESVKEYILSPISSNRIIPNINYDLPLFWLFRICCSIEMSNF